MSNTITQSIHQQSAEEYAEARQDTQDAAANAFGAGANVVEAAVDVVHGAVSELTAAGYATTAGGFAAAGATAWLAEQAMPRCESDQPTASDTLFAQAGRDLEKSAQATAVGWRWFADAAAHLAGSVVNAAGVVLELFGAASHATAGAALERAEHGQQLVDRIKQMAQWGRETEPAEAPPTQAQQSR